MMATPNRVPTANWTNVVVQATPLVVRCRSSIFLPSQTRGNTNNTPPTMIDRFMTFESGVLDAHHQRNQDNAKRAILKNSSTACFMVASCDHFRDRPTMIRTRHVRRDWGQRDEALLCRCPHSRLTPAIVSSAPSSF